jgi:hypothetical protein
MFKKIKNLFLSDAQKEEGRIKEENERIISLKQVKASDFSYLMEYQPNNNDFGISKKDIPFIVSKRLIQEGMLALKGEKIIEYKSAYNASGILTKIIWETADETGLVLFTKDEGDIIKQNELVYVIKPLHVSNEDIKIRLNSVELISSEITHKKSERIVHSFKFNQGSLVQLIESVDDFDGNVFETTEFKLSSNDISDDFHFKILCKNSLFYISLYGYRKHFLMNIGDRLEILTEKHEKIALIFSTKATKIDKDDNGIIIKNEIQISNEIVENLFQDSFINWKLISIKKNLEITGKTLKDIQSIEFLQKFKFGIKALLFIANKEDIRNI